MMKRSKYICCLQKSLNYLISWLSSLWWQSVMIFMLLYVITGIWIKSFFFDRNFCRERVEKWRWKWSKNAPSEVRFWSLKYYKIVKKWPENASKEVQKSKIFLPRRRGHPIPPRPFGPRQPRPFGPWSAPPLGKRSGYAPEYTYCPFCKVSDGNILIIYVYCIVFILKG